MKTGRVNFNDLDIDYINFGSGKEVIVVIPGLFSSAINLEKQKYFFYKSYKHFRSKYNVYIFSKNKKITKGYTIEEMAADQIKVMNELNIEKAVVIGISEGGMIAQSLAIMEPKLVSSLIICVSTPSCDDKTKSILNKWHNYIDSGDTASLIESIYYSSYNNRYENIVKNTSELLAKIAKIKNKKELLIHIEAIIKYNVLNSISKIDCNTLIIGAKEDKLISYKNSLLIKEKVSSSSIIIYEHMGHDVYSANKKINRDIDLFLANNKINQQSENY